MAALRVASPSFFNQGLSTFMQCFKGPAAELFTKHLKTNPGHFDSWMYRGLCYAILGKKSEAVSDYTTAEKYGTPSEKMVVQGLKLQVQDRSEEAVAVFKQITTTYPSDPMGWHYYGTTRFNQGYTDDETASALKKAISLNVNYQRSEVGLTYFFLGRLLNLNGKTEEAIDHLRKGVDLNPTCTVNYIELGAALLQKGSHAEAKRHLLYALELNDTQIEANRCLAKLFHEEKNYDDAGMHAAVFIGSTTIVKEEEGGKGGGGGNSGGSGSSGDDDSEDDDWESRRAKTWQNTKKEATVKAKHEGIIYYKITDGSKKRKIWVSHDTAKHAGSAFKVWLDKRSKIVFGSSCDKNLRIIKDKHESNAGREIKKSDMQILWKR